MANGQDLSQAIAQVMQQQGQFPQQGGEDIDALLAQEPVQQQAELEIQIEPSSMDGYEGQADPALAALFASSREAQDAQQAQQGQDDGQKQAFVRTASTRTVGTRASQGVNQIGGSPSKTSGDLSGIWNSAPDVSGVFGVNR
jgi:hypothetical protein